MFLDLHVPDWHDAFLSQFDPAAFADSVASANATAATIMANTHTGLCTYPTRVGEMHRNLEGWDLLGTTIDRCHARGLDVVVYYCTVYVDWYWDHHPEARIVDAEGKSQKLLMEQPGTPRRFSVCCLNDPRYRDFVVDQLTEICEAYDFEGVWADMAFWPTVCYCPSCQKRYGQEVGGEIPRVIDWADPVWVNFQRKRQAWQLEFARLVTSTIKEKKPEVTVAHQSHTFGGDWLFGPSVDLTRAMDWLSADLYGERYGLSFYAKLFYSQSEEKPFEHLNAWCYPTIHEHVVTKTEDELRAMTFSAFVNHGAMVFIDAVDPVGRVHRKNYETLGRVFADLARYEPYAGGEYCQDVGIYFSFDANVDLAENGRPVISARYNFEPGKPPVSPTAHRNAARNLAKTLIQHHIPFGVVTKKNLGNLANYQIIMLPNVVMLDEGEMEALREYVFKGGSLYASKNTALISKEGVQQLDFLLSDLFGVSYIGETEEIVTYVTPQESKADLFSPFSVQYPVTLNDTQVQVAADDEAQVLATVTLPYTDPRGTRYASILTNPPGIETDYPAIVLNRYGDGKVLYTAGALEIWEHDSQRDVLVNLLKLLASRPFYFEADAPKSVEITLFDQPDQKRYMLHLLNYQQELPNIPIRDLHCRVWLVGRSPRRLVSLPNESPIVYGVREDHAEFAVPELQDYAALVLEYE
jgi:hypothetical protein